jgi:serine/threonine protein kinase
MAEPLLPGARLGKYEILAHIATGGMGAVYKALDVDLGRTVALKVLIHDRATNPVQQERFRREARHAARLNHKNIVTLYEYGQVGGTFFLAMEFIEGTDLESYINRKGALNPDLARYFAIQAARALEHAHSQGIVHRDIKPSNFLLQRNKERWIVKLTDLGLAWAAENANFRVTRAGSTVGTVDYLSPEQARDSSSVDIRSDLYSLGCTLYHMLAGHPPFGQGGLGERIYKHLASNPPDLRDINPQVTDGLWMVLRKLMAKRPEDRYQTPTELKRDLKHLPSPAEHDTKNEEKGSAQTSTSLPAADEWEPGEEVPTGSSGSGVLAVSPEPASSDEHPPLPRDEQLQAAAGQFQRALEAAEGEQWEYALQLLLSCCKLDPGNVLYRQRLREVGRSQARGRGWFAPLADLASRRKVRAAHRLGEHRQVLELGEVMLLRKPDDVETHLLMAEAADALEMEPLTMWLLSQTRQISPRPVEANRTLARMYEAKQRYKDAIALWEMVQKAVPHDAEAPRKINALAVRETLDRGRYHERGAGR